MSLLTKERWGHLQVDREGIFTRALVVVLEVVDVLLHPYAILIGQGPIVYVAAHDRVARSVYVDAEGRGRLFAGVDEVVFTVVLVGFTALVVFGRAVGIATSSRPGVPRGIGTHVSG